MLRKVFTTAVAMAALLYPVAASAQGQALDDRRMATALHKFAGPLRGNYMQVYPPLVGDQILEGLTGPPDPILDLAGGLRLVSGCRQHSCDEKAAVILSRGYRVEAAAIISPHCHWTRPPHSTRKGNLNGPSKCDYDHDVLTVFLHRSARSDGLDKALQDWAKSKSSKAMPHEIVWVN